MSFKGATWKIIDRWGSFPGQHNIQSVRGCALNGKDVVGARKTFSNRAAFHISYHNYLSQVNYSYENPFYGGKQE